MSALHAGFEANPLPADDPRFIAALDLQIAQMRRVLDLMAPVTGAEAMRSLRDAFPEAPLAERTLAVAGMRA
ncbi:hypothetical protein C3941_11640 [Kaistia algarum]|jgi:hypothetical protein|uniref:hypothetical protein n=1 Tax=Kaistia algarum TaxID=2083279 RepID=UPI000CE7F94B|nr:hypothetical protein [Kaistia algarum]MCX5514998.1 hypothetical protein [Kaistia algarum]PPE79740.1 hypothetical protein C3941_11640 [Kaistia algarum]